MIVRNVGPSDAALRWIGGVVLVMLGLIAAAGQLAYVHASGMTLAIVALALGVLLVATAAAHYDVLYRLVGVSTRGEK